MTKVTKFINETLYQMGWNDALGGIRLLNGNQTKINKLLKYFRSKKLRGPTPFTSTNPDYLKGVRDLANKTNFNRLKFKGPPSVIADLKTKTDPLTYAVAKLDRP